MTRVDDIDVEAVKHGRGQAEGLSYPPTGLQLGIGESAVGVRSPESRYIISMRRRRIRVASPFVVYEPVEVSPPQL